MTQHGPHAHAGPGVVLERLLLLVAIVGLVAVLVVGLA